MEDFLEELNANNLKNIKVKFIEKLDNNLDEMLKIGGIGETKYI